MIWYYHSLAHAEGTMGQKAEKTLSQKETHFCFSKLQVTDLAIYSEENPALKKRQSTILVLLCFIPALPRSFKPQLFKINALIL